VVAGREHLASEGEQVAHAAPGGRVLWDRGLGQDRASGGQRTDEWWTFFGSCPASSTQRAFERGIHAPHCPRGMEELRAGLGAVIATACFRREGKGFRGPNSSNHKAAELHTG
jgi:hypothetical protein